MRSCEIHTNTDRRKRRRRDRRFLDRLRQKLAELQSRLQHISKSRLGWNAVRSGERSGLKSITSKRAEFSTNYSNSNTVRARRGVAVEPGAAGATVYVTGRSTKTCRSEMTRPGTIEETAEVANGAGGIGIAVQVDRPAPDQVGALIARIAREHGASLLFYGNDTPGMCGPSMTMV